MEIISNRILQMSESETLAMTQIARELKAQGKDVISLSIGEPDFNTPEAVKEAAKKAIDENFTHYPPVPGYADLREAISKKFLRDNGLEYKPEQIVVSTGAKQSIYQVVMALINPGDEVIIPTPFWVSYKEIVKVAEGKCVYVPTKRLLLNNWKKPLLLVPNLLCSQVQATQQVCFTPKKSLKVLPKCWNVIPISL